MDVIRGKCTTLDFIILFSVFFQIESVKPWRGLGAPSPEAAPTDQLVAHIAVGSATGQVCRDSAVLLIRALFQTNRQIQTVFIVLLRA